MNLTTEQLDEIELMGELFFHPAEVAMNIEADPDDFEAELLDSTSDAYKRYNRGRLKTQIILRRAILQAAVNGSSPSQQMMKEFEIKSQV